MGLLEANFDVSSLLHLPHHPAEWHGEIDMLCVNPIFGHRTRDLLSGGKGRRCQGATAGPAPSQRPPQDAVLMNAHGSLLSFTSFLMTVGASNQCFYLYR